MDVILICKDCEENMDNVELENFEIGDIIECESCGAEHELRSKEPVEILLIEEEK